MKTKIIIAALAFANLFLFIYSCVKESAPQGVKSGEVNYKVSERTVTVVKSDTVPMTANNGDCYSVIILWMSDTTAKVHVEHLTSCPTNSNSHRGLYIPYTILPDSDGKLTISGGKSWYIPLTGTGGIMESSGINYSCFCEQAGNGGEPGYPAPDPICEVVNYAWHKGCEQTNCNDCDMEVCPGKLSPTNTDTIHNANGLIIKAKSISYFTPGVDDRDGATAYYGNNIEIMVSRSGDTIYAERSIISGTAQPHNIFNLTSLTLSDGKITLPAVGTFWFIPFDSGIAESAASGDVKCESKDGCKKCKLGPSSTGCLRCECEEGTGDCDMVLSYLPGGILVEASTVQLTDH